MRLLPVAVLIVTVSLFGVLLFSFAQSQPDCYSISLGFTVTDAAQNIIDVQGLSLVEMQVDVTNSLNRYQQMTGRCFTGELGLIFGTLPDRVFAVFVSNNRDYGVTRVMTETEYYPEPFGANSVGWQHSTDTELSAP
ncbi:MAG: hypothetical protein E6Q97_05685 [Desulfurellales bacterium]|nr:MAG: hypothetical protein E6Q97_05685 [Desulfurellales bacterium]